MISIVRFLFYGTSSKFKEFYERISMGRSKKIFNKQTYCDKVRTITDINKLYNYDDEKPNGPNDREYVACGQKGNYNELQNIYDEKLKPYIERGNITEEEVIKALCEVCEEMHKVSKRKKREIFEKKLEQKLRINISSS